MKKIFPIIVSSLLVLAATSLAVRADTVTVKKEDLVSIGSFAYSASKLKLPAIDPEQPLVDPTDPGPSAALLRSLHADGRAGGFDGVIYENRDRGHSNLSQRLFPSLTHITYGPELRKDNLDMGLGGYVFFPAIVIGNSSTVLGGAPISRSLSRYAMTTPGGTTRAFLTYTNNQIYVYPEHRDYDAVDLFPANWAYTVTTQGSSFSDRPFLRAIAMTVAALPQETQKFLREKGLIAPTVQMILRRAQKGIESRSDYLSGAAHPAVFDNAKLRPKKMVEMAAALRPDNVPPMVSLEVEEEDFKKAEGLARLPEALFDTPSAIARIWRGAAYRKELTVSAAKTQDPNDKDLTFEWVLLQGDPERVKIAKLDEKGTRARLSIDWHDRRPIDPEGERMTNRVDIGVFASNGENESAPGFISISFPGHQDRTYEPTGEDHAMRLTSIDYHLKDNELSFDPLLHWSADWVDRFTYDAKGEIISWSRQLEDRTIEFTGSPGSDIDPDVQYEAKRVSGKTKLIMKQ